MTGANRLEGVYGLLARFAGHNVGADLPQCVWLNCGACIACYATSWAAR